jgi:CHASE2 domain-containing sensor protein
MKDKIKIEIELLRDSLKNIFIVMFAIISGVVGLVYKLMFKFNYIDLFTIIVGLIVFLFLGIIRFNKIRELNDKLKELE